MEIKTNDNVKVNAKTLSLMCKVSDRFTCDINDPEGNYVGGYNGYVPDFLSGSSGEDYLDLDIDLETGRIVNWRKPTAKEIENLIQGEDE
jgi:hypothetical protein